MGKLWSAQWLKKKEWNTFFVLGSNICVICIRFCLFLFSQYLTYLQLSYGESERESWVMTVYTHDIDVLPYSCIRHIFTVQAFIPKHATYCLNNIDYWQEQGISIEWFLCCRTKGKHIYIETLSWLIKYLQGRFHRSWRLQRYSRKVDI